VHDIKSDAGQKTIMGIGFFCSTVMLAASGFFNGAFGYRLGQSHIDGVVFAVIGVAFEVFLAIMPFLFMSAWKAKAIGSAAFLLLVWLFLIGVSANAAVGHIAGSRLSAMSNKMGAATSFQDTRKDLERARKDLEWRSKPKESVDNLSAQVKGQEGNILYAQTSQCANQWTSPAKVFCAKLTELRAKLGDAIEYKGLEDKIAALTAKSDAAVANHVTVIAEGADAQANLYAKALGVDVTTVSGAISAVFASAILMIASVGFYLSMTPMRAAQKMAATKAKAATALVTSEAPATALTADPPRLMIEQEPPQPASATTPAPARPVSGLIAPPVSDEAKELLLAIGMPDKPCDKRPADKDEVLGYRFLAWLVANNYTGDFTPDQIDSLYSVYVIQDNRTPHAAMRIVKNRLEQTGPRFVKKDPNATRDDGSRGAVWTIKKVSIPVLSGVLMKRGIIPDTTLPPSEPEATAPQPQNVYPLFKGEAANG